MHFYALLAVGELIGMASAAYSLVDDFSGNNFFDVFHFETENDPTHGFVNYLSESDAHNANLWDVTNGVVNMRADSVNVVTSSRGRNSVRVSTSKTYQHALIVLDLAHMPANACGIWPAFWMVGTGFSAWPANGEIDIIEGVNHNSRNTISVHTTNDCFSAGELCSVNKGCDINAEDSFLFGDGFNNVGGGVYAIDWTFEHVNIWFWPRSKVPYDVMGANPNPSAWSTPTVAYQQDQGCIIDDYLRNMRLVFDITFCGDWAGSVFNNDGQCAGTCQDYVQNNPHAYKDAYWSINALKVYTLHDAAAASQCPPTNPTTVLTTTVTVTGAPTAPQYLQPLVEVLTDGHWAVGYSVGPPKEKRQLDSMPASTESL